MVTGLFLRWGLPVRAWGVAGRLALTTNLVGHMHEFYEVYRLTLMELGMREGLAALEAHIHHRATPGTPVALLGRMGFPKPVSFNH